MFCFIFQGKFINQKNNGMYESKNFNFFKKDKSCTFCELSVRLDCAVDDSCLFGNCLPPGIAGASASGGPRWLSI